MDVDARSTKNVCTTVHTCRNTCSIHPTGVEARVYRSTHSEEWMCDWHQTRQSTLDAAHKICACPISKNKMKEDSRDTGF